MKRYTCVRGGGGVVCVRLESNLAVAAAAAATAEGPQLHLEFPFE